MSCEEMGLDLVAFHFGVLGDDARRRLEAHLLGCGACLRSFLALKHDIEASAESDEVPSPRAHARLRSAVVAELEARGARSVERAELDGGVRGEAPDGDALAPQRPRSRWETPLAFGFASAAVVASIVATGALATADGARPRGADSVHDVKGSSPTQ